MLTADISKYGVLECPTLVPNGLSHFKNVLAQDELNMYLKWINSKNRIWSEPTEKEENRKVQHYGGFTGFNVRDRNCKQDVQEMPDKLIELFNIVKSRIWALTKYNIQITPDSAQIYSYAPGQGIHQHFDVFDAFEEEIVMLTLAGTCTMRFDKNKEVYDKFVEAGSISILKGDARYVWRHGILKTLVDKNDAGEIVARVGNRVSIVFRQNK